MKEEERERERERERENGGERYNILYVLATYPAHRVAPSIWR